VDFSKENKEAKHPPDTKSFLPLTKINYILIVNTRLTITIVLSIFFA